MRSPATSKGKNMNAQESKQDNEEQFERGLRHLSRDLNREDSLLRACLLDAAICGLRLARNPDSQHLRRDAAEVWAIIAPTLARHLDSEDLHLLPWLDRQHRLSPDAAQRIRQCHDRLRILIAKIGAPGADNLTTDHAREAGQALVSLAMGLDDAIEDEERRLFPVLRKALADIR
jgi:hypothetical protein